MCSSLRVLLLLFNLVVLFGLPTAAQEDSRWRISPNSINIQVGQDRTLQLLDDSAHELYGAMWSVDDPEKADIRDEDGRAVLHAKAPGTFKVSASFGSQTRSREIRIWPADQPIPPGTSWGTDPIGRQIGDLLAAPSSDGPRTYSLEQTTSGRTYLRAVREDGIQVWAWLMPEGTHDVELLGSSWLGGALISANRATSYTLYALGKDGKVGWQYTFSGVGKGHAYTLQHVLYVLSQSRDGMLTTVIGVDELTGARNFELTIPESVETQIHVHKIGTQFVCASKSSSSSIPAVASRLFVNTDGFVYLAFTRSDSVLSTGKCTAGSPIAPDAVNLSRDDRVVLWQIHPDGAYRNTVVEESKTYRPVSEFVTAPSPTGSIMPDGSGGILLSLRWSPERMTAPKQSSPEELVYRIDESGNVVHRFSLPKYGGLLHDDMVLGEHEVGFATRGSVLIAFNVRDGKEIWHWDSNTSGIKVFAALANGHCLVQTPNALVEVEDGHRATEVFQGEAKTDWQGQIYRKHN
jgi:hypothetical protein